MAETSKSIRIDIVSDVVCPWCVIGFKQLGQALEQLGDDRILQLRCQRHSEEGPRYLALTVELIGRTGNLILCSREEEGAPWVVARAFNAGRKGRARSYAASSSRARAATRIVNSHRRSVNVSASPGIRSR